MTPSWMTDDLNELKTQGLRRTRRVMLSGQGVRVRLRERELLIFSSNDYLNLAGDPRLARAAARAARRYGCGAGASPLVSGYLPPHHSLERRLAAWEDAIFSDALNHASLIDGCRLARARVHVYRHADLDHLHDLLRREGDRARRRLIVTDTIFS